MKKTLAFPLALLALAAAPAAAQEDLEWIAGETPEGPLLMYALPDSDYIKFEIACDSESFGLTILSLLESEIGIPAPYTLTLAAGDQSVAIPAENIHLEMLDVHLLEGKTGLDETLEAILGNPDGFTVAVNDQPPEALPTPGEALNPIIAVCLVVG